MNSHLLENAPIGCSRYLTYVNQVLLLAFTLKLFKLTGEGEDEYTHSWKGYGSKPKQKIASTYIITSQFVVFADTERCGAVRDMKKRCDVQMPMDIRTLLDLTSYLTISRSVNQGTAGVYMEGHISMCKMSMHSAVP
ncbi:hypothetical protein HELRODRAFT_173982 [Helobdella robusta]|uniref:Uncharacterized protein n=1 Tax=Helobdella robusta TaxID=6412 RepID=T1F7G0_HELRO|nr:hypothetical protein HELRODRAFT_173982 [Helobdella robusta]ESO03099.1 hypothetical protein HELRODRAFT_173982 [Helobdella robusta]